MNLSIKTELRDGNETARSETRPKFLSEVGSTGLLQPADSNNVGLTVASGSLGKVKVKVDPVATELVVSSIYGVVADITPETVVVKLSQSATMVHFPRSLFDEDLVNLAEPLSYQIVERQNGVRYQRFVARENEPNVELQRKLDDILQTIRYR